MSTGTAPNWPELAQGLAVRLDTDELQAGFSQAPAIAYSTRQSEIGLAVSGGADSVCLALLAWVFLIEERQHLRVLHFNHHRRGSESDGDARFVEELARVLGLGYQLGESVLDPQNEINEAVLREERLAFFRQSGCGVILQGHQRDDILETMLMRLCQGSGTEGLVAPRPISSLGAMTFVRPLLCLGRQELREALESCRIPWREDASNEGNDFLRNRIRNSVVPALREATGREPSVGAAMSRGLLEGDNEALSVWMHDAFPDGFHGPELDLGVLRELPLGMVRRVLFAWLSEHRVTPERKAMGILLETLLSGGIGKVDVGNGVRVEIGTNTISIEPPEQDTEAWQGQTITVPGLITLPGYQLRAKRVSMDEPIRQKVLSGQIDPAGECYLAADEEDVTELQIRPWQPGDRYRPLGAPGTRKVQDIFTDAKIPARERKLLPLVLLDGDLLWIPGFPPAENHRITDRTKSALWLTYRPI